jgi:hypothetical protein
MGYVSCGDESCLSDSCRGQPAIDAGASFHWRSGWSGSEPTPMTGQYRSAGVSSHRISCTVNSSRAGSRHRFISDSACRRPHGWRISDSPSANGKMSLSSLSKLALVLHPTNCSSDQDLLLLLYSSVIEDEMWHLSLIGPTIPQNHAGSRETWWEGKWWVNYRCWAPWTPLFSVCSRKGIVVYADLFAILWIWSRSMEDLRKTLPSKSPDEIIENIRSSFSNDDVTLIGYREGNEAEVRVSHSINWKNWRAHVWG